MRLFQGGRTFEKLIAPHVRSLRPEVFALCANANHRWVSSLGAIDRPHKTESIAPPKRLSSHHLARPFGLYPPPHPPTHTHTPPPPSLPPSLFSSSSHLSSFLRHAYFRSGMDVRRCVGIINLRFCTCGELFKDSY